MVLELSESVERYVEAQVKAGHFPSAAALVEAAVMESMATTVTLTDEDLKAIAEADAEFERGEFITFNELSDKIKARYPGK